MRLAARWSPLWMWRRKPGKRATWLEQYSRPRASTLRACIYCRPSVCLDDDVLYMWSTYTESGSSCGLQNLMSVSVLWSRGFV